MTYKQVGAIIKVNQEVQKLQNDIEKQMAKIYKELTRLNNLIDDEKKK